MKRFKNILVVCDEGIAVDSALHRAINVAKRNEASVTLIDVLEAEPGTLRRLFTALPGVAGDKIEDQILDVHRERLEGLAQAFKDEGIPIQTAVEQGTGFVEVIKRVLSNGHDLVLKGIAENGTTGPFLSLDMHLMRKCPCPVWVIKSGQSVETKHILAAVDPDPDDATRDKLNHTIMELATSLAERDGAKLTVLNVWRVQEETVLSHSRLNISREDAQLIIETERRQSGQRLDLLMADFADKIGNVDVLHVKGIAEDVVPQLVSAEGIDTITMGTVGRTGIPGVFIGNTAETILNRVRCSVLTVKPPNFISPVAAEPIRAKTLS
ncbi:universal stress protein [Aestuariibius sp. 2305UL40-4]|uniref:universal stress protein n=1 Tax=Aestuariibius violaceus TaxID=3234132 RepID=UPI00345EB85E